MIDLASEWLHSLRPSTVGLLALAAAAGLDFERVAQRHGQRFRPFRLGATVVYDPAGRELELRTLLVREVARNALVAVGAAPSDEAIRALQPVVRRCASSGGAAAAAAVGSGYGRAPTRERSRSESAVHELVVPSRA